LTVETWLHRGNAREKKGDLEGAIEDFETYLGRYPRYAPKVEQKVAELRAKR